MASASLAPLSTTVSEPLPVFGLGVTVNVAPPSRLVPFGPFFSQRMEPRPLVKVNVTVWPAAAVFVCEAGSLMYPVGAVVSVTVYGTCGSHGPRRM